MRTASKKITCLAFILLGFTPLLFSFYVLIQKEIIQKKMREKLEFGELQTVIIPEKEVVWMEEDHEIFVNGYMFDIRTRKLENGVYTFTGMYDEEETKLVKRHTTESQESNSQDKLLVKIFKSMNNWYFESSNEDTGMVVAYQSFINLPSATLPDFIPAILTPPPQCDLSISFRA